MIILDTAVPLPQEQRKARAATRAPEPVKRAMERYSEAYKRVYGVPPELSFSAPWISVHGQSQRVKLARLKEMTKQLRYRGG